MQRLTYLLNQRCRHEKEDGIVSYSSWRRGSSLSNKSEHTDDAGVSAAPVLSSVTEVFDRDKCSELIEGVVDIPAYYWPHSFVVSSINSYVNWGHISTFTSVSRSLLILDLFLRAGILSTSLVDLRLLMSLVNSMQ